MDQIEMARNYAQVMGEGFMEGYCIGEVTRDFLAHNKGELVLYRKQEREKIVIEGMLPIDSGEIRHQLSKGGKPIAYILAPEVDSDLVRNIVIEELIALNK